MVAIKSGISIGSKQVALPHFYRCLSKSWCIRLVTLFICSLTSPSLHADDGSAPHVVLIMADDLGFGDIQALNLQSEIQTPHLNRLASESLTFTDAHTPSSVCTPTRYGLLTGRYCWRTSLKRGVLNGYGKPLIEDGRLTLASMLKNAGYSTNVVGKWHLGLGLNGNEENLNLAAPLRNHPGHHGFDQSFIIPASLDFPPYVYFENGIATSGDLESQSSIAFPAYTRRGPRAKDFELRTCLDRLTDEAISIVRTMKRSSQPTFLYFPLTAPHKPVLPNVLFTGSTTRGPYGDFIRQVDHTIGRVINALKQQGQLDNTVLIVTSDNGSFMKRIPADEPDHVDDNTIQGFHPEVHRANGIWRGTKADIWEAGHRVPLFVRLPKSLHAGSRVTNLVGLVDIMATLADWLEISLPEGAGPDSVSFAPVLRDPSNAFERSALICHSAGGMFAIRKGAWKLIAGNGSGGREIPKGKPFGEPWQLVDLGSDPSETANVAKQYPEKFAELKEELLRIKGND